MKSFQADFKSNCEIFLYFYSKNVKAYIKNKLPGAPIFLIIVRGSTTNSGRMMGVIKPGSNFKIILNCRYIGFWIITILVPQIVTQIDHMKTKKICSLNCQMVHLRMPWRAILIWKWLKSFYTVMM